MSQRADSSGARYRNLKLLPVLVAIGLAIYCFLYLSQTSEITVSLETKANNTSVDRRSSNRKVDFDLGTNLREPIATREDHFDLKSNLEYLHRSVNESSHNVKQMLRKIDSFLNKTWCESMQNRTDKVQAFDSPTNLMTIFTTWATADDERYQKIHNNTLFNWASFKPAMQPVLFTNDAALAEEVTQLGWSVVNFTRTAQNGLPILKDMFVHTIQSLKSVFYGFVNADIIFDESLLSTLVNTLYSLGNQKMTALPLLITGKRYNVINVTEKDILPRRNLQQVVRDRGQLFSASAEDYFITNKVYPWSDIPDVVVGSVAYDNWVVLNARARNFTVIDASKTVLAVHQSIDSNDHRSHLRDTAYYNKRLLSDLYKGDIPYNRGFVDCIETFTDIENDTFVLRDRVVDKTCY